DFVARLRLRERWRDAQQPEPVRDPLRPYAQRTFDHLARVSDLFEMTDTTRIGLPMEMRHPFYDLRFISFCQSLPVVPWCIRKEILRRWLKGRVPEEVRRRPKTPLAGYPHMAAPVRADAIRPGPCTPCEQAAAYLDGG